MERDVREAPCEGRETHHLGCVCHEARRDAEVAALRGEVERLRRELSQIVADRQIRGVIGYLCLACERPWQAHRAGCWVARAKATLDAPVAEGES